MFLNIFNYCIKENLLFLYNYIKNFFELKDKHNIENKTNDIENIISDSYNNESSINNIDESVFYNIGNSIIEDSWEVVVKKET